MAALEARGESRRSNPLGSDHGDGEPTRLFSREGQCFYIPHCTTYNGQKECLCRRVSASAVFKSSCCKFIIDWPCRDQVALFLWPVEQSGRAHLVRAPAF